MGRPAEYHLLTIAEKQAHALENQREPSVACPSCDTQTTPRDLLAHVATRCTGPRDPGPRASWIGWRDARALGVPGWSLSRWAARGDVRTRGVRSERRYLLRDVAVRMASRRR